MPYLKQIATAINSELKLTAFNESRFANADFNSLAYPILVDNREDKNITIPCVALTNGEYKPMMFDDSLPMAVYHKVLSKVYQVSTSTESFGRKSSKNIKAIAQMQMICLANRQLIKILPDDLEAMFVMNFPSGKETSFSTIDAVDLLNVKPVSSDTDFIRIWANEFRGLEFQVNQDRAILSLNYTIESTFKTNCFTTCDCQ